MEDEITELRYIIDEQNRRIAKLKSEHPCEACKKKDEDIDKMKAVIDELEEQAKEIRGLTRTNARLNIAVNALHDAFMSIVEVEFGVPNNVE